MTVSRPLVWKWVNHDGQRLYDVGIKADGTLYNPNGYDEAIVHEAVRRAKERLHECRSKAAKKGAATKQRRVEKRIHEIAKEVAENRWAYRGPRRGCFICGKGLSDSGSVARGIGPECWERILKAVEKWVGSHAGPNDAPGAAGAQLEPTTEGRSL